ncbi:Zinc finger protein RTS2 [Pleurostoma richardsiae]|uniref:Zinc finger protein RTS2 n=1 Tax=Pleurostoma richardsiae TaxID=41990 RepID=A0AA38RP21_9PEZI|nr:Zinc finger protein RTS2 [Pleurostoma richardsiae]
MPKAEVGSTKYLSNKLKSKGLGRLRWYCQVCERQLRDENAFKMHTQSEGHVRQMLAVGNVKSAVDDYSKQFLDDFVRQLRTAHGTKSVHINHFYQELIANKEHVHMNATRWSSLTEFAKYLGREGICRVEETDKGLHVAWVDNSPEALKRADALRRKEMQEKGDEEREQRIIREQIRRAQRERGVEGEDAEEEDEAKVLHRQEGEKIKLSFGGKPKPNEEQGSASPSQQSPKAKSASPAKALLEKADEAPAGEATGLESKPADAESQPKPVALKFGVKPQPKNVFAQAKKNALGGGKKPVKIEQPKKMSEAERIMREELERKRARETSGFQGPNKKQRL